MSRENVEVVRRGFESFNRRNERTMVELCHPDVEFRSSLDAVGGAVYRGHFGIEQYFADLRDAFDAGWRAEEEEVRDIPPDQVLLVVRVVGTGRLSEVPLNRRIAHVWRLRDGLLWRGTVYLDLAEALEAVELRE